MSCRVQDQGMERFSLAVQKKQRLNNDGRKTHCVSGWHSEIS